MGQRAICVKPIILSNHAVSSGLLSFCDIKQVFKALTSRNFMHSHIRSCESQLFPVCTPLHASRLQHASRAPISGTDLLGVSEREPALCARLCLIVVAKSTRLAPGTCIFRDQRGARCTQGYADQLRRACAHAAP